MTATPVITRLDELYDVPQLADGQTLVRQGGTWVAADLAQAVLVWDDGTADYLPVNAKALATPKEFRGPVDPQTVAGVVLHNRDSWDATV